MAYVRFVLELPPSVCFRSLGLFTCMNYWMMIEIEIKPIMGDWEMLGYELGRPWGLT